MDEIAWLYWNSGWVGFYLQELLGKNTPVPRPTTTTTISGATTTTVPRATPTTISGTTSDSPHHNNFRGNHHNSSKGNPHNNFRDNLHNSFKANHHNNFRGNRPLHNNFKEDHPNRQASQFNNRGDPHNMPDRQGGNNRKSCTRIRRQSTMKRNI